MQTLDSKPAPVQAAGPRIRRDLDGLSGIAVVLIVVSHVWLGHVSAGYDVLLVLSGFFLGARMLRLVDSGRTLRAGIEVTRVLRRLYPELVLLLAVCAALTVAIQPKTRWEAFANQTLASLGFYQNWALIRSASDHVQASEEVTPLQHLWLPSMLAQLFLFFLLIVWVVLALTRRRDRDRQRSVLITTTAVMMCASLAYALLVHPDNPTVAYFSTPGRAWELFAGVLAAAAAATVDWPDWLRRTAATAGLTVIVLTGLLIDGVTSSRQWALIPVAATVLLISSSAPGVAGTSTPRLTDSKPLVALGNLAYPLYLWHWPLLIFWMASVNDDSVDLPQGCAVIAVAVVMALVSKWLVGAGSRWPRLSLSAIAVVVVLLVATALAWRSHVNQARAGGDELGSLSLQEYPGAHAVTGDAKVAKLPMRPTVLEAPNDVPPSTLQGCVTGFTGIEVVTCDYGDITAGRTIAVAGGSHSEHWLPALDAIGHQKGFKITTYLKLGCPLTTKKVPIIAGSFEPYPQCRTWSEKTVKQIVKDRPDFVFFTTTRPILNGPGDYVPDYYLGIWDELSANGIGMLGIRDTPWMLREGTFFSPVDCLAAGGDADTCGLPRSEALADRNPTLDYLAKYRTMRALDLNDSVCRSDICRAVEGNVLIYHDVHHLSGAYVRTLADDLARQIGHSTSWW